MKLTQQCLWWMRSRRWPRAWPRMNETTHHDVEREYTKCNIVRHRRLRLQLRTATQLATKGRATASALIPHCNRTQSALRSREGGPGACRGSGQERVRFKREQDVEPSHAPLSTRRPSNAKVQQLRSLSMDYIIYFCLLNQLSIIFLMMLLSYSISEHDFIFWVRG